MPRSSRHRSHRSHRRGGSADRSESEGEEAASASTGAREEVAAVARVSRDLEPERRRSSSGKEVVRSGNGYAEHGKKRKERVEEAVVDVVSDRWNSGVCEDHLVDKRSKSEVHGPVDAEKPADKSKGSGDESKRSSRRAVLSDERADEVVLKSDSGKRRSEKEKDLGRRESTGQYKDDRDRDREREREREKEKDLGRRESTGQKERVRERSRDREREKEKEREKEREREREREERVREKNRDRERDRERERQKDREREKKDYDSKHERYEDAVSGKSGSKASRMEDEAYSYRRDIEINEIPSKEKYSNPEKQPDKHSRRKDDSEDIDKWPADNRDSDDRKTLSRYEHVKARNSKEQRFDDDKYKEKDKDDYGRDRRQQDDKFLDERVTRDHESDRADYKSTKDGHRSSESHYRKDAVQDGDHYDDYGSRYKESRGRKRPPEENDDQYDLKPPSARDRRVNLEKSSGSGRLDSLIERARLDRSSSPSKLHGRSSPSPSSYHDKDQSWHGSKLIDHGKREPYDERNIRSRTSSASERTPASRLRDRDAENWSSERFKQKDDHQPRDVPLEISTSSQYDRTPRKDKHTSPKQLSEKSPSSGDQRFSGRLSSGRSLDNKGERNSLTRYRDRDGELPQERSLHQDRTPAKVPFREPTPSGSSISRGGHFSGTSPNHPLPLSARHRSDDSSFLGLHDDDRRPQSGDRRFHGHQKRNDMNPGCGHGHAWNNPPNWPSPVANGFVPIQHGAPAFHPPVHQYPGPPMFNLRPQMKLNQPGVSYPMHDAIERFSTHMRPFGWPNPLDESCPPHLQVWNGGSGVFPGEPYLYGRQEWDQNRPHASSRGWEVTNDASKGLNEVPDAELPVAKKEPDCAATLISESSGGQHNLQPQIEQKEIEHSKSENIEAKDDSESSLKSFKAPQGAPVMTSMLSKNGVVFSKSYLSRISVSHDLVESELYKRCISLLGDLGVTKAPLEVKNELIQNNRNIGKVTRKHGSPNPFSSLYLKGNSTIFQRAMALHKNQTGEALVPTSSFVKTEGKMDLPEEACDTEMLDSTQKEPAVSNPAPLCCPDIIEEGSPSKLQPGDSMGVANPATKESGGGEASPAITQPDVEMEAVAPPAITEPDKDMEDVVPPAIEVPADGIEDGARQVTLEHAADLPEVTPADGMEDVAPSAVGELGDSMEVMPPAAADTSIGKEDAPVVASPDGQEGPSIMHAGAETGIEEDIDKVTDDNNGDGEVNSSILAPKLDVAASDSQDSEALLVESRVNLSRIPNSQESTH
ncbi:uncharacterized protein LOC133916978 [Phragmites australis]|uniref:uncharacterized protein LOC133916978 n=1 Tax=Phragmites australis TaxID=29695 RepID=UPI002D76B3FA|nr:uncharacterized protein LOC133916978 [Phragmites australis]